MLWQVKDFDAETSVNRYVYLPGNIFPKEQREGVSGWRAVITKKKKVGKSYQLFLKVENFRGNWFKEDFVKTLIMLSD